MTPAHPSGPEAGTPPAGPSPRRVVAVVPDLFFATSIEAVARTLGIALELVPVADALQRCTQAPPALVLLDLHAPGVVPALVGALAGRVRAVGFYSHVDGELRQAALAAGLDQALPRSAFVQRLPHLLAGEDAPERSGGG